MGPVLLLDGNSLLFRAFFAIPEDMATSAGVCTNAVYGFTSMVVNLLRDQKPSGMAVAFDRPEPTFRDAIVSDYKAGRAATPESLVPQFALVKRVLTALGIPVVEEAGYEADDLIATLAERVASRGDDVIVVSGDRDTFQLVRDPHVRVLYNKRGVTDYELYDEAGILTRTGVPPSKYVTYAALRGDPSDNLPGVPGVGEKTAARLVTSYGDMDGIYAHLDELTPKLRENLTAHEAQARSNLVMMPLVDAVPIDLGAGDLALGQWDAAALSEVFDELEFGGLRKRLADVIGMPSLVSDTSASIHLAPVGAGQAPVEIDPYDMEVSRPTTAKEAIAGLGDLAKTASIVGLQVWWEGDPGRSPITQLGILGIDGSGNVAGGVLLGGELINSKGVASALTSLLSGAPRVVAHRAKEMMRSLIPLGVTMKSLEMDTVVAAYLLDPGEGEYALDWLARRYLALAEGASHRAGRSDIDPGVFSPPDLFEVAEQSAFFSEKPGGEGDVARNGLKLLGDVATALNLAPVLRRHLAEEGMEELYDRIENPLVAVLAAMEVAGIAVDAEALRALNASLADEVRALDSEIQELAGEKFLVNSTKQLREVLYTRLKLAPSKKTKTGYSTDAASLEKLRGEHPIIGKLLRYREVEKLRSTYGTGLIAEVAEDGRIHASFNQTVARTGRLSSDRPNLHNIPVRSEDGRRFREAFVAAPGCRLLVADYNQIELRVIAHLSGDPGLREAFASHTDIHTATAARIFGVEPRAVTTAQRSKAKMVSYGLSYGMEAFGLASRLGIGVEEASHILDAFFSSFPAVKSYMEETVAEARDLGYTRTELGRRRPIPEMQASNRQVRMAGERQAMNAGTQGLAADIFKLALVKLAGSLEGAGMASRVVLQVHDEVVVEVPAGEEEPAERLTRQAMEHAYELRVPLEVEIAWGDTWAAAKG